jgi:hypothetical protein
VLYQLSYVGPMSLPPHGDKQPLTRIPFAIKTAQSTVQGV